MAAWSDIQQGVERRHPFLTEFEVRGSGNYSGRLPEVLQASIDVAENLRRKDSNDKQLAMFFPRLLDCPEWVAVGCTLAVLRKDFFSNIGNLTRFNSGQKLLLDGKCVVEFESEQEIGGERHLWMRMSAKGKPGQKPENTVKTFPVRDRLRFQPTDTKRPLTPIENIDSNPSAHPLDRLLGISSFGNRSIFANKVLLVSRLTRVRQFAENTRVLNPTSPAQSVLLRDLFQWGGITVEGELEQWGHQQIEAEPVIGVAPSLIALREYLLIRNPREVIIVLDGTLPFDNDLPALDEICAQGFSVLALMEHGFMRDFSHLRDRGFKTWIWSASALTQIKPVERTDTSKAGTPFHILHRTLKNYAMRQIQPIRCDLSVLDEAAEILQLTARRLQLSDPDLNDLLRRSYNILLNLSQLLRPIGLDDGFTRDRILADLERIKSDVESRSTWLDKVDVVAVCDFLEKIKAVLDEPGNISRKIDQLECVFNGRRRKTPMAIVVADASEVSITDGFWRELVPKRQFSQSHFVALSELSVEQEYDSVIVCGWLGAKRMSQLYDSCISPSISVLCYPFETTWLRSGVSRWRRQIEKLEAAELTVEEKASIFKTDPEIIEEMQGVSRVQNPSVENRETTFDVTEFELRLRTSRRDLYANRSALGETTIEARFVDFSDERFAYFRPNHKVPVATDFIDGNFDESTTIPLRDISQLNVGDYVIFREGSDSDILRDLADKGLARAGKSEHRRIAGLWKRVLRQFVSEHPDGFEGALVELWDSGLKVTELTVRSWLNDRHRIGPRSEKAIEIIALVSGNNELQQRLEDVRQAITEVRGAHQQAARFLIRKLIAHIPSMLKKGLHESHTIDIEDIGRAIVVRIEFIDEVDVQVSQNIVNRRLTG